MKCLYRIVIVMLSVLLTFPHAGMNKKAYADDATPPDNSKKVENAWDQYGHIGNCLGNCGPTSIINSMVFLKNKYPNIYDRTKLIVDWNLDGKIDDLDHEILRDRFAVGWPDPNDPTKWRAGSGYNGSDAKRFWQAKYDWFQDFAPGTTRLSGMVYGNEDIKNWPNGNNIVKGFPTWSWLWQEIKNGEDVEIIIETQAYSHAMTLTGMYLTGGNNDEVWDQGEEAWIRYLDPNNQNTKLFGIVQHGANQELRFYWMNEINQPEMVYIRYAYAESPVPEPTTILLLGLGLIGLSGMRRKFRK